MRSRGLGRSGALVVVVKTVAWATLLFFCAGISRAQTTPTERVFAESKSTVEKAVKRLQPAMSGRLPAIEGFALVGDHPLTRYQRTFYQSTMQVSALPTGGSVVRVNVKVTAWYADPNGSHSGYELLSSNGRLEADLLDQLSDQLGDTASSADAKPAPPTSAPTRHAPDEPTLSAPMPSSQQSADALSSSSSSTSSLPLNGGGLTALPAPLPSQRDATPASKTAADLQAETSSLEEVLKNQGHPKNLVAVKKSGTPVVASPSLSGKTLFLADAHDEFEMLDFGADWVHVRISGLSRGWIWRTSLEMPEGISDIPPTVATHAPVAADVFQVSREETAQFPGDWEPLRGKSVKIISVQKIRENEQSGGASEKLEYAKSLLDKNYEELAKSPELAGVVLIFDSVDGGMIAATAPTIQRWKAGALTDAALWHRCYFDPPETFSAPKTEGAQ